MPASHNRVPTQNHMRDARQCVVRESSPAPERQCPDRQWSDGLVAPRVRLAQVSLDESMFSILARIDEALMTRSKVGDTETLNRIQDLFTSRFRNFGL